MITAAPFSNMTIPESLGISVLGMIIVFLVLVFLMVIIYIMTSIIKRFSAKTPAAVANAGVSAAPAEQEATPAQSTAAVPDETIAESTTSGGELSAAPTAYSADAAVASTSGETAVIQIPSAVPHPEKRYRVVIGGALYDVDAVADGIADSEAYPGLLTSRK